MEITARMVKHLRDSTGAGIMDCKNALKECDGDQEKAVELLRIKGAQRADARSDRVATEGVVVCAVSEDRSYGALVEINSETDFVSRGDVFRAFALPLAEVALTIGEDCDDIEVLNGLAFDGSSMTVEQARQDMLLKISENIQVRRMRVFRAANGSRIGRYVHRERIGILTEVAGDDTQGIEDNVAVHIAVMKPRWVDVKDIPQDILDEERKVYLAQAKETGKPETVLEKIVSGRVNKFSKENTLLNQPYYDDEEQTVGRVVNSRSASVTRFCIVELGK